MKLLAVLGAGLLAGQGRDQSQTDITVSKREEERERKKGKLNSGAEEEWTGRRPQDYLALHSFSS